MTAFDPPKTPSPNRRVRRWARLALGDTDGKGPTPRQPWDADLVLPAIEAGSTARERFGARLRGLDRTARVIAGMIVFCLVSIWLVFGVIVHASNREHWENASVYADNVAKLLSADLETNFAICNLSLEGLLANLSSPELMSLPYALRHELTRASAMNLPVFSLLFVIDKDGTLIEDVRSPNVQRIDVSDRDYFRVQRDRTDAGLFIDHPFRSRVTGDWVVGTSRRINKDGRFDGVVAGGLKIESLRSLYAKVHLPPGSSLALRYEDGTVMMSNPPGASAWTPAFIQKTADATTATIMVRPFDQTSHLTRVRKIPGLPLYQSVSLPVDVIMRNVLSRTLMTASGFLFLSVIISALGFTLMRELARRNAAEALLQRLATLDGLTGLRNRRCFDETLQVEVRRGARTGATLALLIIDVDYFKAYNDTYGHSAGDAALRAVADILSRETLRPTDVVARVGGEEFAVLASDTDLVGAASLADRIRRAVRESRMPHAGSRLGVVTISVGLACLPPDEGPIAAGDDAPPAGSSDASAKSLFDAADAALYQAKRGGRDRAEMAPPSVAGTSPARTMTA